MKIAFVVRDVNQNEGPARVTAALIERFCDEHEVSVFSSTVEGVDVSKIRHYRIPTIPGLWLADFWVFLICSTIVFGFLWLVRGRRYDIVHTATGLPLFFANVTTSHFCQRESLRLERTGQMEAPPTALLGKLRALDYGLYRRLLASLEGLTFGRRRPKVRIVVSESVKREYIRHYSEAGEDIIVIPNGVDCQRFHPDNKKLYRNEMRQQYGIPEDTSLLLFAGNDWERKGVRCIIETLSFLPEQRVRLLVVGKGDTEAYEHFALEKQVREQVAFIPHTRDISHYYAASDIFTFPTLYEPFGLAIVEAMASGLPVITSRVAGAAEYITDGVSGLLLETPHEPQELASKIALLLSDTELRDILGRQGRQAGQAGS